MGNPQKENGYTAIANEILEALIRTGINGAEWAVVMFILRKTYGFQKKEDQISLTQFEKSLPFARPTICKALKVLQLVKIIELVEHGNSKISANRYRFNKNYEQWQLVSKSELVKDRKRNAEKKGATSKDLEMQLVSKPLHTKETITKERAHMSKDIEKPAEDEPKKIYGNVEINEMIEYLKTSVGVDDFADVGNWTRIFAKHCLNLKSKLEPGEFEKRLNHILEDNFKRKNCNKIKYIYYQIKGYMKPTTHTFDFLN